MAKRKSIPMGKSKRSFTKTAKKVNSKNGLAPMRGGIRL